MELTADFLTTTVEMERGDFFRNDEVKLFKIENVDHKGRKSRLKKIPPLCSDNLLYSLVRHSIGKKMKREKSLSMKRTCEDQPRLLDEGKTKGNHFTLEFFSYLRVVFVRTFELKRQRITKGVEKVDCFDYFFCLTREKCRRMPKAT